MTTDTVTPTANPPTDRKADEYIEIALAAIRDNQWNPRRTIDREADAVLERSIREKGILEPMIVRINQTENTIEPYEVVAGSRRLRCARAAGLTSAFCVVKDLTDAEALEVGIIENINRRDMHPLDEADAYARLMEIDPRIYTTRAIAARTGQTESHVYRRLRLLDLDASLRKALAEDRLTVGHAERLVRLTPALRKQAVAEGAVWADSPLLENQGAWHSRDDLQPLAKLEAFIRTRSHFDPASDDARHFQPELIEQVAERTGVNVDDVDPGQLEAAFDQAVDKARAQYVELSEDPLVRSRLGAKRGDRVPLAPSQWREVGTKSCQFSTSGIVTHGGPARVVSVCVNRKCPVHWPAAKKPAAGKKPTAARPVMDPVAHDQADREWWARVWPAAKVALVKHLRTRSRTVPSAALLRMALGPNEVRVLERAFDVRLNRSTFVLFLALKSVGAGAQYSRAMFLDLTKPWKFNLRPVEERIREELKQIKTAALEGKAKTTPARGGKVTIERPTVKRARKGKAKK